MRGIEEAIQIVRKLKNCTTHDEVRESVRNLEELPGELNLYALAKLKRDVEYLTKEVDQLAKEGHSLEMILANRGIVFQIPKQLAETTAMEMVTKIMESLVASDEVRKIGVYGMGGVGKTTVMNIVNNQLIREQKDRFDRVIWVPVSAFSGIMKLQDDIARQLNVELPKDEDVTMRAVLLSLALQRVERYVLILDNMWEGFHLDDIGIPTPSLENGCKIVLTTRSLLVCNFVKCHQNFEMGHLLEEEAWELFLKHVGEVVNYENLKGYMKEVARECACLPLAVKAVASSMAGKSQEYEWRIALDSLKAMFKDPNNEYGVVIERLRFSYDMLKNEKLKKIVLFCTLYPVNHMIVREEVVELLIDDGIIEGRNARQSQLDEGHSMLKALENVCLLQCATQECVKMHDLIRDMALQITHIGPPQIFMVEAGLQLKTLPEEEKWSTDLVKVSLMSNNISEIHRGASPKCPNLSTLMLQNNLSLTFIASTFFSHLVGLEVLNLSNTSIRVLPNSISTLRDLVALSLNCCKELYYVPSLRGMKLLKKLDLRGTLVSKVPNGLEELTSMRYLDLTTKRLDKIPKGTLSKLSRLEYLATCVAPVEDIESLKNLETFQGAFLDIHSLNQFSKHVDDLERGPSSYSIIVDPGLTPEDILEAMSSKFFLDRKWRKFVKLFNWLDSNYVSPKFPRDVEHLAITYREDITSLPQYISSSDIMGLKECVIGACNEIEYLFSSSSPSELCFQTLDTFSSSPSLLSLQTLESLSLMCLDNFRGWIRSEELGLDQLRCNMFSCLKRVSIVDCAAIKEVFPLWLVRSHLKNLEFIILCRCEQLEEILADSSGEEERMSQSVSTNFIPLPKFIGLFLYKLPKLKRICSSSTVLVCESLKKIIILECEGLKRMPFEFDLNNKGQPSSLEMIHMKEDDWQVLEWNHPNYKSILQPLCQFSTHDGDIWSTMDDIEAALRGEAPSVDLVIGEDIPTLDRSNEKNAPSSFRSSFIVKSILSVGVLFVLYASLHHRSNSNTCHAKNTPKVVQRSEETCVNRKPSNQQLWMAPDWWEKYVWKSGEIIRK